MLYQILLGLGVIAMIVANRQRRDMRSGGFLFFSMSITAVGFVLADFYPSNHPIAVGVQDLCFAMLPPLYFCTIKNFTNLALPQWQSLRAFILGVPLLLGINSAVSHLSGSSLAVEPQRLSLALVGYTLGVLSICICAWRFISTPRQRQTLVLLMVLPAILLLTHVLERLSIAPEFSSPTVLAACIAFASVFNLRFAGSSVRPVPRSTLVDQVRDVLVVFDPKYRVIDYNEAAADWLAPAGQSLVGQTLVRLFPSEFAAELTDDAVQTMIVPWHRGSIEHWFEVHIATLIVDKKPNGKIVTLRDISRRRQAEIALEQSRLALEEANTRLAALANTDPLTELANRRHTLEQLDTELERHRRSGMTLGLLVLDLDHFKQVNDNHGHPVGDRALVAAAQSMTTTVRDNDCVGRIGGEEFAILVVDASPEGPAALAERVRANLAAVVIENDSGVRVPITASIGCVNYSGGRVDSLTLMKLADQALYAAKNSGRNRVEIANYQPLPGYGPRTLQAILSQQA